MPQDLINMEKHSDNENNILATESEDIKNNKIPLTEDEVLKILQYIPKRNLKKKQRRALYKISPIKAETKLGRNELCKCGSGEKYKYCCLTKDDAQKYLQRLKENSK